MKHTRSEPSSAHSSFSTLRSAMGAGRARDGARSRGHAKRCAPTSSLATKPACARSTATPRPSRSSPGVIAERRGLVDHPLVSSNTLPSPGSAPAVPPLLDVDGRLLLFTEIAHGGGRNPSVYLRGTDGSPAVRLGEGRATALSPDGRRALVLAASEPSPYLDVLPTGPGEPWRVVVPGFSYHGARWLPDGERIVASAEETGREPRLYVQDLSGAAPRAITPPGVQTWRWAVAPDGSAVAVTIAGKPLVFALQGGEPQPIQGLGGDDRVVAWIERGLLVEAGSSAGRGMLSLLDPENGRRLPGKR